MIIYIYIEEEHLGSYFICGKGEIPFSVVATASVLLYFRLPEVNPFLVEQ